MVNWPESSPKSLRARTQAAEHPLPSVSTSAAPHSRPMAGIPVAVNLRRSTTTAPRPSTGRPLRKFRGMAAASTGLGLDPRRNDQRMQSPLSLQQGGQAERDVWLPPPRKGWKRSHNRRTPPSAIRDRTSACRHRHPATATPSATENSHECPFRNGALHASRSTERFTASLKGRKCGQKDLEPSPLDPTLSSKIDCGVAGI